MFGIFEQQRPGHCVLSPLQIPRVGHSKDNILVKQDGKKSTQPFQT